MKNTLDLSRWPFASMTMLSINYKINNASRSKHFNEGFLALEFLLLPIIETVGDGIRQDDLIKLSLFSKSTISRQLEELKKRDYVEIYPDENNGYFNCVRLKERGRRFAKEFLQDLNDLENMVDNRLGSQYELFVSDIRQMLDNMKNERQLRYLSNEILGFSIVGICLMSIAIHESLSDYAAKMSLDNAKFHILLTIAINGGRINFKKVESYLQIKQSGIVKQVHKLCEMGYLETVADEKDKRVKWIIFAKEHEELLAKIMESVTVFEEMLLSSTKEPYQELLHNLYAVEDIDLELIDKYRI